MAEGNGAVPVQPVASLMISLFPGGTMNFSVPDDEILGRGLLDKLRACMDDHYRSRNAGAQAPRIALAGPLPVLRRGGPPI